MMDPRLVEKLETLDGSRRRDAIGKAAVRLEDLQPLLELAPRLQSAKAAGATPTQAEFDALVDDVHALHRRLMAVVDVLQQRVLR